MGALGWTVADLLTPSQTQTLGQRQTAVIGTVASGLAGDTLSLTETSGLGTLSLGPIVDGRQQIDYQAPDTIATAGPDAVSYMLDRSAWRPDRLGLSKYRARIAVDRNSLRLADA
jgi:hypothetical protein